MNLVSIIVASHGQLAGALISTSEMIAGPQKDVSAVTLAPSDGIKDLAEKFAKAKQAAAQKEILIFADLWGGSPFNAATQLVAADPKHTALIAGVNLPLLIEAYMVRDQELAKIVTHLSEISDGSIKQFKMPDQLDGEDDLL
ncbi:PTS sugar transporter subunit IIA [Lentilactobacillus parafarraginis]|nr:mannose/fructose/sorbose PTS transporter subunit IIA [Lentilactobacillus parafarraginis]